jgi:APA family basic amino acid/polyamine antiporter
MAWIIGWDLIHEYGIGAAMVGIAWSEYLNKLLEFLPGHHTIPYAWCHSPFESMGGAHGILNLPAVFIILMLSLLLIRGMKESAVVNGIIVVTKVIIVILIIACGWAFISPANHTPYIPEPQMIKDAQGVSHHYGGFLGILGAAGVVFFAFIGFDAVSTAAQETVNPKRDMPIGILGSLVICTVLYILFAHVLTGIASVDDFRTGGKEASVAYAITQHMPGYGWLAKLVTVAILFGFTSVILVMLMGQSRVFFSMSRDGLVPRAFSDVHPKYRTPYKSNLLFFVFVGAVAAVVPGDIVGDMSSIGTLFAFVLVCIGVWVMRVRDPNAPRQFKVPMFKVVATLGVLFNSMMIFGLGWPNWVRLGGWLAIGLVIYFLYSRHHSKVRAQA